MDRTSDLVPAPALSKPMSSESETTMNDHKKQQGEIALGMVIGLVTVLGIISLVCFVPGFQPRGYTTSPVVCPPSETDSRGYCFIHRDDEYQSIGPAPVLIHISRSGSGNGTRTLSLVSRTYTANFLLSVTLRLTPTRRRTVLTPSCKPSVTAERNSTRRCIGRTRTRLP